MNYVRDSWCGICTKRLDTKKKSYLRKISLNSIQDYRRAFPNKYSIEKNDVVCGKCRDEFYRIKKAFQNVSNDASVTNNVIDTNGIESFVFVEKSELNQIVKDSVQCE